MIARLSTVLGPVLLLVLLLDPAAPSKDKKKAILPEEILRAQTVRVVIDPNAGEPLDQPNANATARANVEKALTAWGRFQLLLEGQESDLVILIRTGDGKFSRPTIKGGPIDQRPGIETSDGGIRIGGQQGQGPPLSETGTNPQSRSPHVGSEVGPTEDSFEVYRGRVQYPLDSPPAWRYVAKDALRAPKVAAVEEFRKAVAEAEKPKVPKSP